MFHHIQARAVPRALPFALLAALLLALVAIVAPTTAQNPPGNNGTVKIDGLPFDDHPNNEPHPGCVFQVDFYGYDEGDLTADVTFEHWNPTGDGHGDVLLEDTVFIGEDDNSGGGSEAGLDASATYDLSAQLAGMDPHPQQGFHIKLTVNAEGSQGADVKHKVFWVECAGAPPPPGGQQGSFLLQKVDQAGAGRAGAVFTLTGVMGTSFSGTATTSATGSAAFGGLAAGNYTLAETTPPSGCTGFSGTIAITIAANGTVTVGTLPTGVTFTSGTLRVVNNCGGSISGGGNLPLLKVDQNGNGRAGAVFTLTGVMGTTFNATSTTGANGAAGFASLAAGTYTLAETTPPSGCTGFSGTIAITIAANGTVTVGTLPTGVTFSAGTLRVVNNCGGPGGPGGPGGGTLPSQGGPGASQGQQGQAPVRQGTLAGQLPDTAVPATGGMLGAISAVLMLAGLAIAAGASLGGGRRRR